MNERLRPVPRVAAPIKNLARRFSYAGLVVFAFALMLLGKADLVLMERFRVQVTDAVAPILDAASRPVATITDIVSQINELADIRSQNMQLHEDNRRLLQWQTAARRLEAENNALRDLLKFTPDPLAGYVTARVVADTGGVFAHNLLINVGEPGGIKKDQPVITGEGLVGRIAGVGGRSSWVLLITDLNSHIPVLIEQTRTRAIMAGNNTERPRLIHLPQGVEVSPGQRIITSGHGGVFPPGLPIGVVASVSDNGIEIQTFMTRSHLEYVRIVDFGSGVKIEPSPAPAAEIRVKDAGGEKKTP